MGSKTSKHSENNEVTFLNYTGHRFEKSDLYKLQFQVGISKYPRYGNKIAPTLLQQYLNISLLDKRIVSELKLCDLDESSWNRFSEKTCHKLGAMVIDHLKTKLGQIRANLSQAAVPKIYAPNSTIIALEMRTYNALKKANLLEKDSQLFNVTIGEILELPGFGIRCLVDLLTTLESRVAQIYPINSTILRKTKKLLKTKGVEKIFISDPRFGTFVQALNLEGQTLKERLLNLIRGQRSPVSQPLLIKCLTGLERKLRRSVHLILEEELEDLVLFEKKSRNKELLVNYLGLNGKGPRSLESVGQEYGLTRERVRQITDKQLSFLSSTKPYLPILKKCVKLLSSDLPCSEVDAVSKLRERGLTKGSFNPKGIISATTIVGVQCPFVLERRGKTTYLMSYRRRGLTKLIVQAARKAISHWGVTTIEDVTAQALEKAKNHIDPSFVITVLSNLPDFRWLDKTTGWFWLKDVPRNSLITQINKILSVSEGISLSELRSGTSRHHRREGFAPPQRVLLELCKDIERYKVTAEGKIIASPPLDWKQILSDAEKLLVHTLKQHGPVLSREKLEEECIRQGMIRSSFYIYLTYSPVITKYARGVYGLRGANIQPGLVDSLVTERPKSKVVKDYGWTDDGHLRLVIQLSKSVIQTGSVGIPSSIQRYLQGKFIIKTGDGFPIGNLSTNGNRALGLISLFKRRGGDAGDFLLLVFDLNNKEAIATISEEGFIDEEKIDS